MDKENKNQNFTKTEFSKKKQDLVSITYEEIGFFPRSFSRVFDRFLKQIFSEVDNLVIQEYRFYRYLFLTTLKCMLILFFVPFIVNYFSKTYLITPLTQYFWNTQQSEIFLNSYQQKRAFSELKEFEEKLYFESLINFNARKQSLPSPSGVTSFHPEASKRVHPEGEQEKLGNPESMSESLDNSLKFEVQRTFLGVSPSSSATHYTTNSLARALQPEAKSPVAELEEPTLKGSSHPLGVAMGLSPLGEQRESKALNLNSISHQLVISKDETNRRALSLNNPKRTSNNEKNLSTNLLLQSNYGTNETNVLTFEQRLHEKTVELAIQYNTQSIEAITNFFADLLSFGSFCYLLSVLEIQINITKSFLLEVFFGLDDSKKSLIILLMTDLLVGYHSSNLWELFFEFLFNHYGLPESQTGIFLLVATLPVLLDVLFKYLIFRHLNRSSPTTVATFNAMIE
jgi:hypothetical protein